MTIPIVPGPWSFLANIGQGVANYGLGKEQHRQTTRKETVEDQKNAWDRLQFLFQGVQSGDISPNVVKSPLFQSLVEQSGIGQQFNAEDVTGTSKAQVETARAGAIPGRIAELSPTGRRQFAATGNLPTGAQEAQEIGDVRAQSIRGKILGQNLTPEQQAGVAGVPTAGQALAGVQATEDPTMGSVADRIVQDLYIKTGRLPTPAEAFSRGTGDLRARAFGQQLNEPFYGAAIERLRAKLQAEKTAATAAEARAATSQNVVKDIKGQQEEVRLRISARQQDNARMLGELSALAKIPGIPQDQLSEVDRQLLARIQMNNEANVTDQATLTSLGQQARQEINPRTSDPEASLSEQRNAWDRAAREVTSNKDKYGGRTPQQVLGPRP